MRLSRAILVMLLLHVVAVGGIFAFSYIKERDTHRTAGEQVGAASGAVEAEDSALPTKPETLTRIANDHGVTLEALVAVNGASTVTNGLHPGQELKLPEHSPEPEPTPADSTSNALNLIEGRPANGAPAAAAGTAGPKAAHLPPDSGKTYVIGKGENAYVIAQKLKVSSDALIRLNQIADAKKLKPGQKLRIPAAVKPPTR